MVFLVKTKEEKIIMAGKKATNKTATEDNKAVANENTVPAILVRIDKMVDVEESKVKAFVSANIGNAFAIHGIRIIETDKGSFVSMPSNCYKKNGKLEYSEVFHPISKEAHAELEKSVMAAYEAKLEEEQSNMGFKDAEEEKIKEFGPSM